MRRISALGLMAILAACVSAPDAPAVEGMSMAEYAKTCSSGEPNYGNVGRTVYADCPSKPDEWVASDGAKITAIYTTPEFITHQQDLQCGADQECRGRVATATLEWAGQKRLVEQDVKTESRDAWVQFLFGPSPPGAPSEPFIIQQTAPSPMIAQPAPSGPKQCRTYQLGKDLITECN